jgi:hypothetical protein
LTDEDFKDLETLSENKSDKSSKEKEKEKKKKPRRSSDTDYSQDVRDSTTWDFERSSIASLTSSPEHTYNDLELDDIHYIPEKRSERPHGKSFHKLIKLKNTNESPIGSHKKGVFKTKNERDTMKMSIINSLPDDVETLRKIQDFISSQ